LTDMVLSPSTPDTRAFAEPINPLLDGLLVCHTPLPLDKHFAAFSKEYQRSLTNTYAHMPVVTVSGNGTPYPEYPHRDFITQVSCFYALGKVWPEDGTTEPEQVIDTPVPLGLPGITAASANGSSEPKSASTRSPQLVPVAPGTETDPHRSNGVATASRK